MTPNAKSEGAVRAASVAPARKSPASTVPQEKDTRTMWLLWTAVICGFLFLASAWFFLIRAAREANVESVPLVTKGGRP